MSYSLSGGANYEKIHPSLYFILLYLIVNLGEKQFRKNLIAYQRILKYILIYLIVIVLISATQFLIQLDLSNLGYLLNTHIAAAAVAVALLGSRRKILDNIMFLIYAGMLVNSSIAIGEFLLQKNIIGVEYSSFFRSNALLDHPLNNALLTVPVILSALSEPWDGRYKFFYVSVLALSLLAFGARAATIILTVLLGLYILAAIKAEYNIKIKYLWISFITLGLPVLTVALLFLYRYYGLGRRLFEKALLDTSGMVRLKIYEILMYFDTQDIIFGSERSTVLTYLHYNVGVSIIENFWLQFLLYYGLIFFIFFAGAFFFLMINLVKNQRIELKLCALSFIVIASTNNSLSTKTSALVLMFSLLTSKKVLIDPKG